MSTNSIMSTTFPNSSNNTVDNKTMIITIYTLTVDQQNTDIEEYVSAIADLHLHLNRCKKELVESNQER
jgi:hypothetical protein